MLVRIRYLTSPAAIVALVCVCLGAKKYHFFMLHTVKTISHFFIYQFKKPLPIQQDGKLNCSSAWENVPTFPKMPHESTSWGRLFCRWCLAVPRNYKNSYSINANAKYHVIDWNTLI